MHLFGIDGCRGGWVVARADGELAGLEFSIVADLVPLFREAAVAGDRVVIDIPIGLSQSGGRACDRAARRLLSPGRVSSVFPPPGRAALAGSTYAEASALNFTATGKRISRQTFGILPKIQAVDALLTPELEAVVFEGHPEVTFAVLRGGPLTHGKKAVEGLRERREILAAHGVACDWDGIRAQLGRARVQPDDLLDAAALLLTARRIALGQAVVLPEGPEERDARGLRMTITA